MKKIAYFLSLSIFVFGSCLGYSVRDQQDDLKIMKKFHGGCLKDISDYETAVANKKESDIKRGKELVYLCGRAMDLISADTPAVKELQALFQRGNTPAKEVFQKKFEAAENSVKNFQFKK